MDTKRKTTSLASVLAGALAFASAAATAQTYTTVASQGPSANRVDMVFIGDGYLAGQLDTVYAGHVDAMADQFFNGALDGYFFGRYEKFFNVHRVNVASPEAGADIPQDGVFVDTALDAYYDTVAGTDSDRLLRFSTFKANSAVNTALAGTGIDVDMRFGVVNADKYGGSGGTWAVYAGANGSARNIALHEIGHSFVDLADEYGGFPGPYTGSEPSEPNATKDPAGNKWSRWLGYDDPDTTLGPVGAFEGSRYYDTGLYRPTSLSRMRSINRAFDAIGREAFLGGIYGEVDPLDDWLDFGSVLNDPAELWVDTVDDNVIGVDWYVDGQLVLDDFGPAATPADLGLTAAGDYDVRALAYDRVLDASFTGGTLDWWRLADTSPLEQAIDWQVQLTLEALIGDYNADGFVSQADLDLVLLNWGDTALPPGFDEAALPGGGPFDDLVGQNELDGVLLNWGNGDPPSALVIPEPTSFFVLVFTGLNATRRRKPKGRR